MTCDIKYFGTPLAAQLTLGEIENVKPETEDREGFFMRTLKQMSESYRRYWEAIADSGIPARLQ
ncbi:MAG: hypothetical protein ABSD88_02370 [Candidatus Korobacteraceae bacterium]|jgi:hypothetical protein